MGNSSSGSDDSSSPFNQSLMSSSSALIEDDDPLDAFGLLIFLNQNQKSDGVGMCSESTEEGKEIVCLILNIGIAAFYILLFLGSAGLLANKFSKERERRWQVLFHGFIMASCLVRVVYFILGAVRNTLNFNAHNIFLDCIPAFLFFSSYFVLLFFWAELYHNNTGRLAHFRPHYILLNVAMYSSVISLLILDVLLYDPFCKTCGNGLNPVEKALHLLTVAIFYILGFVYALYGYRLYHKFSSIPSITSQRYKAHRKVVIMLGFITCLFTTFFFLRATIVILWLFVIDYTSLLWFDPVYYFLLEIVPITLLFYVFYRTATDKNPVTANPSANSLNPDSQHTSPASTLHHGQVNASQFAPPRDQGVDETSPLINSNNN